MKFNKRFTGAIIAVTLSFSMIMPVMAENKTEVQQSITSLKDEQSAMESELADLKNNKSDLESYIAELDQKIADVVDSIQTLSDEMLSLNDEIHTAQLRLVEAEANQDEQYKALKARIKVLYENGENDYLQMLLSGDDLNSFLSEAEYRSKINDYDAQLLDALKASEKQIADYKADLETQQADLEVKEAEYADEKASLEVILVERQTELSSLDSSITSVNNDILSVVDALDVENQKLTDILTAEKAAQEALLAQKAAEAEAAKKEAAEKDTVAETTTDSEKSSETETSLETEAETEKDTVAETEKKTEETEKETEEETSSGNSTSSTYDGPVLTASAGTIKGPSGKETYYNLNMNGVVSIMRNMGFSESDYPYWVRSDGCKMLGDYIMVAANFNIRPRGTTIETSLGMGLVCDTGGFASSNSTQLDLAVNW